MVKKVNYRDQSLKILAVPGVPVSRLHCDHLWLGGTRRVRTLSRRISRERQRPSDRSTVFRSFRARATSRAIKANRA